MRSTEVYSWLRQTGLRITPLKRMVVDIFLSGGCGLSAGEVFKKVSEFCDQSSVYRCLRSLTDAGFLRHSMGMRGVVLYRCERRFFPDHGHFHCHRCGETIPVESILADGFLKGLEQTCGITVDRFDFMAEGMCKKCSESC